MDSVAVVRVDLAKELATVEWRSPEPKPDAVIQVVNEAGFSATKLEATTVNTGPRLSWVRNWKTSVYAAVGALIFLMIAEWGLAWHSTPWFPWISFGIATFVQSFCGSRFYLGAWRQLLQGRSNMDTLVSLGSTAAYVFSTATLFSGSGQALFFMESVGIIAFVSVGHFIESMVARRASGALESLLSLTPDQATKVTPTGPKPVPVAALVPGDHIVIAPGDQLPVDGLVTEGESSCDEAMLTGESIPVDKQPSSRVYAGTVNLSGQLIVAASDIGRNTALARIIAVVEQAQTSRADVQKLADRISSIFVPIVVVIALLTFAFWLWAPQSAASLNASLSALLWSPILPSTALAAAVIHAAAVLIIACPCAMGLATPIAIMAGTNVAAKHGVLIRDGQALERSGEVSQILFDKTGTLTRGTPEIRTIHWVVDEDTDRWQQQLASMTAPSRHPLSQAISRHLPARNKLPAFASWTEHPGKGIEAQLAEPSSSDGERLRLGSIDWLREQGLDHAGSEFKEFQSRYRQEGCTVIGFANRSRLLCLVALRDQLKLGAKEVVKQLMLQGLEVSIVSGDHEETAQSIAAELDIPKDRVFAKTSPTAKADLIKSLQQGGAKVCFVGDGINDAPALEQANLGIAVRTASDIAKESADIILLQSDIQTIPKALAMARGTLRTIKQNLFWAFFYNAVGIPLAALGFLSPLLCAAAMGLSDLVVVGNALRLRFRRF